MPGEQATDTKPSVYVGHLPEPFTAEAGYGEHSPVDEDAELGLIEPSRQRAAVQRLPCRVIAKGARDPGR